MPDWLARIVAAYKFRLKGGDVMGKGRPQGIKGTARVVVLTIITEEFRKRCCSGRLGKGRKPNSSAE
jgi:hypothetical protein